MGSERVVVFLTLVLWGDRMGPQRLASIINARVHEEMAISGKDDQSRDGGGGGGEEGRTVAKEEGGKENKCARFNL